MKRVAMSIRAVLALSAAVGALALPAAAHAQSEPEASSNDEIVVTAQKREEDVQDVPISISVVGGDELKERGATQIADYAAYIPGFQVDNNGSPGRSTLSLRGVAPLGPSATVGTYLDDGPIGSSGIYNRSQSFTLDLLPYDIERIEVLRGPQGTLYGASTIGGLLKYVTVQPDLSGFSVRGGGELFTIHHGSDLGYAASAMVNVPLVDNTLGITASYSRRQTPGYIDNVQTGEKDVNQSLQQGGRVGLLWKPSSAFTLKLSAIWQRIEADDFSTIYENPNGTPLAPGAGRFSTNSYLPEPFVSDFKYYSASLEYDLGFASLSSSTAYSKIGIAETTDASYVYGGFWGGLAIFPARLEQEKWTEELRLTSAASEKFEWMLGFFYTKEDNSHDQVVHPLDANGDVIAALDPFAVVALPNTYKEYAVFANATYKFSSFFHLSGGLRWAKNDQTFRQVTAIPLIGLDVDEPGSSSEDVVTYSVSPQLHFSDDAMLYARVASGYRPGGPNVVLPGFPTTVKSDTVVSYEVGFKGRSADHKLSVDAAIFRLDWDDLQTGMSFGSGISGLVNAGKARSVGVEAALLWEPVTGLSLGANGAYTRARCLDTTITCATNDRLPYIPKFSGAVTADYRFALSGSADARIGGALRHTGERISAVPSDPTSISVPGYTALDVNASVTFGGKWTVRAYARNLTDTDGSLTASDSVVHPGTIATQPLQPRTIGVALDLSF